MVVGSENNDKKKEVDASLQKWRQGDFVLSEQWFVHRFDPELPLTIVSEEIPTEVNEEVNALAESAVRGFVVITQTCDIVRSCSSRPFLEVVPLVEVDEQYLSDIQRGRRPQYAFISGAANHFLVADLDRVMTVEKAVVVGWERQPGCHNERDVRLLGQALARKRIRFAFPDDFNEFTQKLQTRLQGKHDKLSPEGEALRSLREIRVRAAPSWDNSEVQLMFWFIRDEEQIQFQGKAWHQLLEQWLQFIPASGRFQSVEGQVVALEDITAKDYVESDPLDLDHLSR